MVEHFLRQNGRREFVALTLGLSFLVAEQAAFAQSAPDYPRSQSGLPSCASNECPPPDYPMVWCGKQPEELFYKEGSATPPGYHPAKRIRRGPVIAGSLVLGIPYLYSVFIAFSFMRDTDAPYGSLMLPIVGPFVVAGAGNFSNSVAPSVLVMDGLLQAGGAAMLLAGIFDKEKLYRRDDVVKVMKPEVLIGPGSIGMKLAF